MNTGNNHKITKMKRRGSHEEQDGENGKDEDI
jgi:hypothetical protein